MLAMLPCSTLPSWRERFQVLPLGANSSLPGAEVLHATGYSGNVLLLIQWQGALQGRGAEQGSLRATLLYLDGLLYRLLNIEEW